MKTKLLFFLGFVAMLVACKGPVEMQSGREDMAYLVFTSPSVYWNKVVDVSIDGGTTFEAKVVKTKRSNYWGRQYGIATGRRKLKVSYKGETIYQKEIFVSSQETKVITLP